ncbi:MAG: cupin [Lentisphaerae bacterium GWF2_45_14]|nr:MAG: cupin [Lentisphaerae bacterium GWF2_45_14]
MKKITVKRLEDEELCKRGIFSWPIWEKEVSKFSWIYSEEEACYIVDGKATVTPLDGQHAISVSSGDYVVFPAGLECIWEIHEAIKKHFNFE